MPGRGGIDAGNWDQPGLRAKYLGGVPLFYASYQVAAPAGGPTLIPNAEGGHVEQRRLRGGTSPAAKRPMDGSLSFLAEAEEEFRAAVAATVRGRAVAWFPELPWTDTWDALAGQALFSTSRELPYGGAVPGVTTSTHPVTATLNGMPQTVFYGAAPEPEAGEVGIVDTAGAQWRSVVTPPLSAADVLVLIYYPLMRVHVDFAGTHEAQGQLTYALTLREALLGRFD